MCALKHLCMRVLDFERQVEAVLFLRIKMRRLLPTCDDNARVIGGGEKRNETRWLPTDDDAVLLAGIAVYNNNKNNNDIMSIAVIDRPKRFSGRKLSQNSITLCDRATEESTSRYVYA